MVDLPSIGLKICTNLTWKRKKISSSGTFDVGACFHVAHGGATGKCSLKTVGLSAVCDRKAFWGSYEISAGCVALEMDGEEGVFYRLLPKVVSLKNLIHERDWCGGL